MTVEWVASLYCNQEPPSLQSLWHASQCVQLLNWWASSLVPIHKLQLPIQVSYFISTTSAEPASMNCKLLWFQILVWHNHTRAINSLLKFWNLLTDLHENKCTSPGCLAAGGKKMFCCRDGPQLGQQMHLQPPVITCWSWFIGEVLKLTKTRSLTMCSWNPVGRAAAA